ncbi:protein of unknown function [Amycolatopsis pretoriensis]|uniref:DUF397 domain-containing protein n=1 Tax=Amycolatopsis pretoriensis TaxID=218821 RepID=A0A1H5RAL2_9PSEU|nr:DUF397 domain-containing protein [Amycolatopsis pretoriensis]SEF35433.1 protein of unknown function [Amycolatopsis pretoriensis]
MRDWRKSSYSGTQSECVEVAFDWRTASYSATEGNCVEVGWRKASYSGAQSECVEVKVDRSVGIRDTKAREQGQLTVTPAAWTAVLTALRG